METAKAVRIGRALAEADLVIIGASNGLDMAEGLNLFCADAHFQEAYGDLAQADGIGCILQGLASPDASVRRRWAERFHQKEYLEYEPGSLMNGLRRLTEHADTLVVTCNIDGHFARAGFDENRVLETEGGHTHVDRRAASRPSRRPRHGPARGARAPCASPSQRQGRHPRTWRGTAQRHHKAHARPDRERLRARHLHRVQLQPGYGARCIVRDDSR